MDFNCPFLMQLSCHFLSCWGSVAEFVLLLVTVLYKTSLHHLFIQKRVYQVVGTKHLNI